MPESTLPDLRTRANRLMPIMFAVMFRNIDPVSPSGKVQTLDLGARKPAVDLVNQLRCMTRPTDTSAETAI